MFKELTLTELTECRKAFEKEYRCMGHMSVDPRDQSNRQCKDFVNEMTQARWCAFLAGWQIRSNK